MLHGKHRWPWRLLRVEQGVHGNVVRLQWLMWNTYMLQCRSPKIDQRERPECFSFLIYSLPTIFVWSWVCCNGDSSVPRHLASSVAWTSQDWGKICWIKLVLDRQKSRHSNTVCLRVRVSLDVHVWFAGECM